MASSRSARIRAGLAVATGLGAYGAYKFGEAYWYEKQKRRVWTQPYKATPMLGQAQAAKLAQHVRALERGIRGGIFYRTESGLRKYVKR